MVVLLLLVVLLLVVVLWLWLWLLLLLLVLLLLLLVLLLMLIRPLLILLLMLLLNSIVVKIVNRRHHLCLVSRHFMPMLLRIDPVHPRLQHRSLRSCTRNKPTRSGPGIWLVWLIGVVARGVVQGRAKI
jgi:hypothetical protein